MLGKLINQHALADAQAGNWDAVAGILNAPSVAVRNPKQWTIGDLQSVVSTEATAIVAYTIEKAGIGDTPQAALFRGAFLAINGQGLQLHTDERQKMIDDLGAAGGWPDVLTAAVKSAGLTYTSLAVATVTAEQCQAAYESARLAQQWTTLQNELINPAASNRSDLIAALRSAVATLEKN